MMRRVSTALALAVPLLVVGVGLAATPATAAEPGDPTPLTIVVPLTVPPNESGLLGADTLTRYTAPLGLLSRQLDALAGAPVAIGLDPLILASIRVLGSSAPPSALEWLDRLEAAPNEMFALSYADADVAAAARTGSLDLLAPLGFDFAINPDNFGEPQTATPTPTPPPTDTPEAPADEPPPLPDLDDLIAWPYSIENVAWPADDTITADEVPALVEAGYETVILSSTNVSGPQPTLAVGDLTAAVSDAAISTLLRSAVYAPTDAEFEAAATALEATLAAAQASAPGRGMIATLDRHWPLTNYHLTEVLSRLSLSPSIDFERFAAALGRTPASGSVADRPEDDARISLIESALLRVDEETAFATVLDDQLLLTAPRRLELLAFMSVSWLPDPEGWSEAGTAFLVKSNEILDSVNLAESSELFLLARSTDVRIPISNALPYPVTVRVTIAPDRPILRVIQNDVLVEVEEGATKTVFIPVEAITNGQVTIRVTLTSPTGVPIDAGFVRARLQAEWETVGTVIVLALVVLIFGFGIARTVLKRRRARAAPAEATPETPDGAGD